MLVQNLGQIKTLNLPDSWQSQDNGRPMSPGMSWEVNYVCDSAPNTRIIFKGRGMPIDNASRQILRYVLSDQHPNEISNDEIVALHTVMGVATTGDNQYTNHNPKGSIEGPAFFLNKIHVEKLGPKSVLRIEGQFSNDYFYDGIVYPAGVAGQIIEELYLQSLDTDDFINSRDIFDKALNSLTWRL